MHADPHHHHQEQQQQQEERGEVLGCIDCQRIFCFFFYALCVSFLRHGLLSCQGAPLALKARRQQNQREASLPRVRSQRLVAAVVSLAAASVVAAAVLMLHLSFLIFCCCCCCCCCCCRETQHPSVPLGVWAYTSRSLTPNLG